MRFPIRHNYQGIVAKFVSRPHLENEIIKGLLEITNPSSQINFPFVVLHGIGGMGKTTLARKICQYARDFFDENSIWTDSEREEQIINSFAKLLERNDIDKENVQEILKKYNSIQFESRRCLLIFDNVKNFKMISKYLPLNLKSKLSVLITSNGILETGDLGDVKHIQVETFTEEEFIEFVKKIIDNISKVEMKILAAYTGKIPYLANIVCFGLTKWKRLRRNMDINEYLEINDNKLLSGEKAVDYTIYKRSPEEIVERQMKTIQNYFEGDGIISCNLLFILAYCNSVVNKSQLIELVKNYVSFAEGTTEFAIEILIEQGFLEQNEEDLSIHRSYQRAIQNILRLQGKEQTTIEQLFDVNSRENLCVNYTILWELGKEYGDPIYEKMANSKNLNFAFVRDVNNAAETLQNYVEKTRSKKEYNQWLYSVGSHIQKSFNGNFSYLKIEENDFFGLLEKYYKSITNGEKNEKRVETLSMLIFVAFQKAEWLDRVIEEFGLLHVKLGPFQLSLLHLAAIKSSLVATKYLLVLGLDVNLKDKKGHTPLHHATRVGSLEVVQAIWEAGADLNCQNNVLRTPLYLATLWNLVEIVQFLISHNADAKLGLEFETPLETAIDRGHREITQLLVEHIAKDVSK